MGQTEVGDTEVATASGDEWVPQRWGAVEFRSSLCSAVTWSFRSRKFRMILTPRAIVYAKRQNPDRRMSYLDAM
eukprot:7412745-Pyramimonas_sp.AAC.1